MRKALAPLDDSVVSTPVNTLDRLGDLVTLNELAAYRRLSPATIRRRLRLGTFMPLPWDRNPYLWRKADIAKELAKEQPQKPRGLQGFASPRMRAARATLRKPTSRRNPVAS